MKNLFFLSIFFLFLSSNIIAQDGPPLNWADPITTPTSNVPIECAGCLSVYTDCVDQTADNLATFLAGATVTISCGIWERDFTIDSTGILCTPDWSIMTEVINGCQPKICMNHKNWEVCEITEDCHIIVTQYLDQFWHDSNPKLNGDQFPAHQIYADWQNRDCYNYDYEGNMNQPGWPHVIDDSCNPPFILDMIDFETPPGSGMCLQVLVSHNVFGSPFVDELMFLDQNNQVDITHIVNAIPDDNQTKFMQFRAVCCTDFPSQPTEQSCNMNTYKSLFVKVIRNEMTFNHEVMVTNFDCEQDDFTLTLPQTPQGPDLPRSLELPTSPPYSITPFSFNILNWYNPFNKDINWQIVQYDCDLSNFETIYRSGTIAHDDDDGFTTNIIVQGSCQCFRVDLTYASVCDPSGFKTRSYYFRDGSDCTEVDPCIKQVVLDPPGLVDGEGRNSLIQQDELQDLSQVKIKVNPVVNGQLTFTNNWSDSRPIQLHIFDAKGQAVRNMQMMMSPGEHTLDFLEAPGLFFYKILEEGRVHSGKIVIQ